MTSYKLPELSYDYSALEPSISARIMELHHSKHHAAYVAGANGAIEQLAEAREKGETWLFTYQVTSITRFSGRT